MEEKRIRLSKEDYELLKEKLCDLSNTEAMVKLMNLFEEEKDYMEIPFDFDKVKEGLPVKTKSGYDVRIICWDRLGEYPIVGLVKKSEDTENVMLFDKFGTPPLASSVETESLVCVAKKQKVWVSIYLDEYGCVQVSIPSEVNPGFKVLDAVQVNYFPQ